MQQPFRLNHLKYRLGESDWKWETAAPGLANRLAIDRQ